MISLLQGILGSANNINIIITNSDGRFYDLGSDQPATCSRLIPNQKAVSHLCYPDVEWQLR